MNKAAAPLVMSTGQREALTVLSRSRSWTATRRQVKRAMVVLMAADGPRPLGLPGARSGRGGPGSPKRGLAKFSVVRGGRGRKPGSRRRRSRRSFA